MSRKSKPPPPKRRPSRSPRFLRAPWLVPAVLAIITLFGFYSRLQERRYFEESPIYWAVTQTHLALSRALADGHPFSFREDECEAAARFLAAPGAFHRPLTAYDAMVDSVRAANGDTLYEPCYSDQSGWGTMVFLVRHLPGFRSLYDVSLVQILLDLGALLLLYPIAVFVTGRRWIALLTCGLYAVYFPAAYAAAEPFRDGWPGFAVIYATALMLPVWKRGPDRVVRSALWLVGAGVLIGIATYVRSTAVVAPVVLAVITWILWRRFRVAAVAGAVLIAATVLTLVPWMVFTARSAGVVSLTSSGSGHSLLTGLGEDKDNPLGLRFRDQSTADYVIRVCGYDVPYGSFPYSAACQREAKRFISGHRSWYAGLVAGRLVGYVVREPVERLKWGWGTRIPQSTRIGVERFLAPIGLAGLIAGLFFFPYAWIPLVWVVGFGGSILPVQTHPRLLLGVDWALLLGISMLVGLVVRALGSLRDRRSPRNRRDRRATRPSEGSAESAVTPVEKTRGFLLLGAGSLAVDVTALVLLTVFAPRAPVPAHDWRREMASPDPAVRFACLDRAGAVGHAGLPVLLRGKADADPGVRAEAEKQIAGLEVLAFRVDFASGAPPPTSPPPGATFEVVSDPGAQGPPFLRITGPAEDYAPLLGFTYPHAVPGSYRLRVRARFDHRTVVSFLTSDPMETRRGMELTRDDMIPMTGFRTVDVPFEKSSEDSVLQIIFGCGRRELGDTSRPRADFEFIELWMSR
jgi:hypothetical protein